MDGLVAQGFAGSVLVACGDDVMFAGAFGLADAAGRTPSYWLASISKQFTAAAILRLQETGRLSISDPLARFFPDAPADKRDITLEQLLTHTSGFARGYAADGITEPALAARAILAAPLAGAPGAQFRYSNNNYSLLALIVAQVSGRSFETYVRDEVFARAGLRDAGFWPDPGAAYVPATQAPVTAPADVANWGFRGATGMRASVPDLHRWVRALQRGDVLSAESRARMFDANVPAGDGDRAGYGWFRGDLNGHRWLWTRGAEDYGPNAILYVSEERPLIVITATNAGPAEEAGPGWSRRARDVLMAIYAPPGAPPCG